MAKNNCNNDELDNNRCYGCRCNTNPCDKDNCQKCCTPGPQGPAGPQGPVGPIGPQGPRGNTGAAGASILGSYATYAELILAHPTGTAGDAYLVAGQLYVWQAASESWVNMGSLIGPQGERGEPGAAGANGTNGQDGEDGIVGEISGISPTVNELPQDVTQGTIYYVEEDNSLYLWDENLGWRRIEAMQGPRGPEGPEGPQGEQGERGGDGIMGAIAGVVATVTDLPQEGITQGTIYYVENDGLYVWDEINGWTALGMIQGPRGIQGEKGEPGDSASSYMIIPFASVEAPKTFSTGANPSAVSLLGFGYGDRRLEGTLDAADYSIPVEPNFYSFTLTGNDNKQLVFSLPFDVSIRSLYITVGTYGAYNFPTAVFPYVQLYSAPEGTNTFTAITDAFAIPSEAIGPNQTPADTMRAARKTGLDIKLPAGTRIGIGALMQTPGETGAANYWLYFTGGIGLSYEPEN